MWATECGTIACHGVALKNNHVYIRLVDGSLSVIMRKAMAGRRQVASPEDCRGPYERTLDDWIEMLGHREVSDPRRSRSAAKSRRESEHRDLFPCNALRRRISSRSATSLRISLAIGHNTRALWRKLKSLTDHHFPYRRSLRRGTAVSVDVRHAGSNVPPSRRRWTDQPDH